MTPWNAACALADALKARYTAATTGRRWKRPPPECPSWCAGGHHCSASFRRDGQHRSLPFTWPRPYGGIVITRTEGATSAVLELRAVVRLDGQRHAELITTGVDMTIRAVLAAVQIDHSGRTSLPPPTYALAGVRGRST
jgi:hypothetical protein